MQNNSAHRMRVAALSCPGTARAMEPLEPRKLLSADFNQDSRHDLVWQNKSTGETVIIALNADQSQTSHTLGNVPAEWDVEGYGDFNLDGDGDILWRNSETGENVVWLMDDQSLATAIFLPTVEANSGWEIEGVGDFGGDARADLLWRNQYTGENLFWIMGAGGGIDHTANTDSMTDLAWHVGGVGDFSGNGQDDILWHNDDTGENVIWLMNGASHTSTTDLPTVQGTQWSIGGVGNFTGDSDVDVLWRRSTDGASIVWRMDGTNVVTSDVLNPETDGDWNVGGGDNRSRGDDWDRNGTEDILWLDSQNGRGLQWYLNGTAVESTNSINNLGQQVRGLVAVGDFDGQRGLDFLVRDPDSGQVSILLRVGGAENFKESERGIIGQIDLAVVSDPDWVISGVGDFNGDEWLDIMWRRTDLSGSGTVVWQLANGHFAGSLFLPGVAMDVWASEAVYTNDADDTVDIYWRNLQTGENVVWTVSGDTITGVRHPFTVDDQAWQIQHALDLSADGVADIIWVNRDTAEVRVWFYDAAGYSGTAVLGSVPTADSAIIA